MFTFCNKETAMQKRFCTCGTAVWVCYLFNSWSSVFFNCEDEDSSALLARCPCCGNKLDINQLK
ncbi:MAG: hypothetical protein JMJ96_09685 [Desulfovibrio alaskensis]|jgi:hypothetical protein|nr:hypothetical protein [Oleidesulfovibrio alaskensis]MBL3582658.1 hypothetical protein [Oleidesulfovibrio alaskensis]